jgi:TnpA family transposase
VTPKDSLHAVDLLYRRDGGVRPEVFISDTGSYSDMVFGLLKLLGVAYRRELADCPIRNCGAPPRLLTMGR